jgi:hypothetical protein
MAERPSGFLLASLTNASSVAIQTIYIENAMLRNVTTRPTIKPTYK